ncbi:MAG TPA: hypothetical protein VM487_07440, partial [Phycisphaerae bacterium]|nr:hypothetical protein [Phycisphaerae bacterium]
GHVGPRAADSSSHLHVAARHRTPPLPATAPPIHLEDELVGAVPRRAPCRAVSGEREESG